MKMTRLPRTVLLLKSPIYENFFHNSILYFYILRVMIRCISRTEIGRVLLQVKPNKRAPQCVQPLAFSLDAPPSCCLKCILVGKWTG